MFKRKSFIAAFTAICFLHSLISPYVAFALENVNDKVQVIYGRPITDRRTFSKTVPISVKNNSTTRLYAPIRVVINQITDNRVTFSNPDGGGGSGTPYLEYSVNALPQGLAPGQETPIKNAVFTNGAQYRFNFSTTVFAELDKDGDGFTPAQGDCDDNNASVHPNAQDIPSNGIDENCDGADSIDPNLLDKDSDGFTPFQGDCNDNNQTIHPGAQEIPNNGIDEDCDQGDLIDLDLLDQDQDGYTPAQGDCDDSNPEMHPNATEIPDNGQDDDCNPSSPDGPSTTDADQDGYTPAQGDCNDNDITTNPGAIDFPGDGIDQNCDGVDSVFVPKVVGLTQPSAESAITTAKLKIGAVTTDYSETVSSGLVISQIPAEGQIVAEGSALGFVVSLGRNPGSLPPDPSETAPDIDSTVVSGIYDSTVFLYSGSTPIQTGVEPGVIDPKRTAVLRGKVLNLQGNPLSGIHISVPHHPEFGHTLSRADGMFDLAVNGGGYLTVGYQREGYLTSQRQVNVPWQDYVVLPDVVMMTVDPVVTDIDLPKTSMQVARGSIQTDNDGDRQATILFPAGTTAKMIMPDGAMEVLSEIHVRATEYTTGPNGLAAMPGELPSTTGYTYAVELSADEAILAGAKSVAFNRPVYFYVENFLGFPTGMIVPTGYYDYEKASWIPSDNGVVIKIIGIADGKAIISTDSANNPATATILSELGVSDQELAELARIYSIGQTFWRVPITHFSPFDTNWPSRAASGSVSPDGPKPIVGNRVEGACMVRGASTIECENQTLGENVSIVGTPFELVYKSDRQSGRKTNSQIDIRLSGETVSNLLKEIVLKVEIAGRVFAKSFPAAPNQTYRFEWDGLDAYGRSLQGSQKATVKIGYVYPTFYVNPPITPSLRRSFGSLPTGTTLSQIPARRDLTLWQTHQVGVGAFDARTLSLGGWSIDVHHVYDPSAQKLYMGNGEQIYNQDLISDLIIETVVGGGTDINGKSAKLVRLNSPRGITVSEDGTMYIADTANHRVLKIDTLGAVVTVTGNGTAGFSGDGGLAIHASLNQPADVKVGQDGSLYIADWGNHRIRRIDPSGVITTFAGNGVKGFSGDGGPAEMSQLSGPTGMTISPDGFFYVVDRGNNRIRQIDPSGDITTVAGGAKIIAGAIPPDQLDNPYKMSITSDRSLVLTHAADFIGNEYVLKINPSGAVKNIAGTGTLGNIVDGQPATKVTTRGLLGICVDSDDDIFISQTLVVTSQKYDSVVRHLDTTGILNTIAGQGVVSIISPGQYAPGFSGDNGPAKRSQLNTPGDLSCAPDGALYIADSGNHRIRRIRSSFPNAAVSDIFFPSQDGNLLYHFNSRGRHLATLDALNGQAVYKFHYDSSGRLIEIEDIDGLKTIIQRDSAGNPIAIISPYNQKTLLKVSPSGYLAEIANPAGETTQMNYTSDGLMTSFTNPRGHVSTMTYDAQGRLTKDENPSGGFWKLEMTENTPDHFVVERTTALNRLTRYQIDNLTNGNLRRRITNPSGLTIESVKQANATQTAAYSDGTKLVAQEGPDPRFQMLAPIAKETTFSTPAGLLFKKTITRTATLSNPIDILSLQLLKDIVNINGRSFIQEFDQSQKLWTLTSAVGRKSFTTVNEKGRPVKFQSANLEPIQMSYDSDGRITTLTQGTGAQERLLTFAYNPEGYVQTIKDPLNRNVQYEYDAAGRVTEETLPDGREIIYTYDANGNISSIKPPGRPEHEFVYTPVDLVEDYTPPPVVGTGKTTYLYNLDKQLTRITRPDGQMIQYDYDSGGRLGSMTTPRGTTTYAYSSTTGNLATISAPDGNTLSYTYDGSLPLSVAYSGIVNGTVSQTYNNNFWTISQSINGSSPIAFTYDNDGLLTKAGSLVIQRDAVTGFSKGTTLGNATMAFTYNTFGELITSTAKYSTTTYLSDQYTYDKLSRITQKTETTQSGTDQFDYSYDLAGRLTEVKKNGAVISTYTYDANGNRLSRVASAGTEMGTYDDQDRLLIYGNFTYSYTANGELKNKKDTSTGQTTQYDYDLLGNLIKVVLPDGKQIEYIIDGQNRRVGKKINDTLVQGFLYEDQLNPVAELDGSNAIVSRFVYGSKYHVPDYMIKGGATYRIISDHLGSVRMVVDISNGAVAQKIEYDEFGRILSDTNPSFQPFGFAGGINDQHTFLTRYGYRDYDAFIGRWTAKDPIRFASGDTNVYGYVVNDPVNWIDSFGLSKGGKQRIDGDDPLMDPNKIKEIEKALNDPNVSLARKARLRAWLKVFKRGGLMGVVASIGIGLLAGESIADTLDPLAPTDAGGYGDMIEDYPDENNNGIPDKYDIPEGTDSNTFCASDLQWYK